MFEAEKLKLGIFAAGSILTICVVFILVGTFDFGTPKVHMMTFFGESVQGLENGSFVKYRGVPIGKVKDITISTNGSLIRVDMEIYLNKMRNETVGGIKPKTITAQQFYRSLEYETTKGLRARIELNGITGGKYIDLDFHESPLQGKFYETPGLNEDGVFYMPSEPSMMSGLRTNAMELLVKISSIDYKGIADRLEMLLTNADKVLSDPNLKESMANLRELSRELGTTSRSLNHAFNRKRLDEIGEQLVSTLGAMKKLSAELESTVRKADLPETASVFRRSSEKVSDTAGSLDDTVNKLNDVADSLSELLRTLDNNPAALITGRKNSSSVIK